MSIKKEIPREKMCWHILALKNSEMARFFIYNFLFIANGYNAIIVSDHNTIKGGLDAKEIAEEKYNDSIIIVPAIEYRYG